jgi:hypothetical protein
MSNLRRTRSAPRGYTLPTYICFDCGRATKAVQSAYRGGFTEHHITLVCRNGTGCHKSGDAQNGAAR